MPDASDILKDPTVELAEAWGLSEEGDDLAACSAFRAIHRHLLAGGSLPAQWLLDNTAAGHLAVLVRSEAMLLMAAGDANDKARGVALMRALHGLGMEVE